MRSSGSYLGPRKRPANKVENLRRQEENQRKQSLRIPKENNKKRVASIEEPRGSERAATKRAAETLDKTGLLDGFFDPDECVEQTTEQDLNEA
jgi:hypothetical protein